MGWDKRGKVDRLRASFVRLWMVNMFRLFEWIFRRNVVPAMVNVGKENKKKERERKTDRGDL